MDIILNYGFAWIAVVLTIILTLKYFLRKGSQKNWKYKSLFIRYNQSLKISHKYMGICLIAFGFIHGLYSSQKVLSINLGTISFILTVFLGINYIIRKRINKVKPWIIVHRFLTVTMVIVLVLHVIDVGGIRIFDVMFEKDAILYEIAENSKSSDTGTETRDDNTSGNGLTDYNNSFGANVKLKDGTYTGIAQAFGPNLTVSVEIKGNRVIKITVTSHRERDSKYYSKPMQQVPQEIIDSQSLDVDTVTRGTFTSVGIINAVNDALSQALVSGTLPPMKALPGGRNKR